MRTILMLAACTIALVGCNKKAYDPYSSQHAKDSVMRKFEPFCSEPSPETKTRGCTAVAEFLNRDGKPYAAIVTGMNDELGVVYIVWHPVDQSVGFSPNVKYEGDQLTQIYALDDPRAYPLLAKFRLQRGSMGN